MPDVTARVHMLAARPEEARVCPARFMLRRTFWNWFQPHYPYIYATFRGVER